MAVAAIPLLITGAGMAAQAGLSYLMRPKLPPVEKGKYDDIRVTLSTYGTFIPRILTGKARLSGIIDFSNGVQHYIIDSPSSGGKGAPSAPSTRTHVYQTSLGIIVCRGVIDSIPRVWADADLITGGGVVLPTQYLEAEDAALAGGASVFSDGTASGGEAVQNIGSGGKVTFTITGTPPPAPDTGSEYTPYTKISFFYKTATNKTAVVSLTDDLETIEVPMSFLSTDNWTPQTIHIAGHYSIVEFANPSGSAPNLDKISFQWYWVRDAVRTEPFYELTGNVNPNVNYPTDLDDPSEFYNFNPSKDAGTGETSLTTIPAYTMRTYTGTETQTQDAAEVAWLDARFGAGQGVLRANAHRGLARVVLENYTLKQGRVQNFTFEIDKGNDGVITDAIEALLTDVGLTETDWDMSEIEGLAVVGFLEHQQTSRNALIDQLQQYFHFRRCEIDGQIKFIPENAASLYTIEAEELRAHADTEEMPAFDAEVLTKEEQLLPLEVRYSVMNPNIDYRNESVPSTPLFGSPCTEKKDYNFAIIDDTEQAKERAEIQLLKEHVENKGFEYFGMPSLQKYAPGDVLTIALDGVAETHRIERKQVQLPIGKIRFIGVSSEQAIYGNPVKQVNETDARDMPQRAFVNFPRNSVVVVIPSISINEADNGRLGVYLAVSGRGRGAWENCALYREYDEDNYVLQEIINSPSPVGVCQTVLGSDPSPPDPDAEDATYDVTIYFFDDIELESVTADDLDRYPTLNLMRVGGEWVQFRTATAETLPENSSFRSAWTISNLRRAQFNTAGAYTTHDSEEDAALVTPSLRYLDLEAEDIGETINLKAVTNRQSVEFAPVTSFVFEPLSRYSIANAPEDERSIDVGDGGTLADTLDTLSTLIKDTRY